MCDRIAVMHEGSISGFLDRARVQRAERAAAGGRRRPSLTATMQKRGDVQERPRPARPDPRGRRGRRAHQPALPARRPTSPTPPTRSGCSASSRSAQAFVIITGGIELSVGSIDRAARRDLHRPDRQSRRALGARGADRHRGARHADGRWCTALLITKMRHAAVRRDAVRPADLPRHRALLHRRTRPPASASARASRRSNG